MIYQAAAIVADAKGTLFSPGRMQVDSGERSVIRKIGRVDDIPPVKGEEIIDLGDRWILPGFVQAHIHLNQTLFRGMAEKRELLPWLEERIWPLEAAHTQESVYAAARFALQEIISSGCTAVLTMETTRHTDSALKACDEMGIRGRLGTALMDLHPSDRNHSILRNGKEALKESVELHDYWMSRTKGLVGCCIAPRFVLSCSRELLAESKQVAGNHQMIWHSHVSENRDECALVEEVTGLSNLAYFNQNGWLDSLTTLAHGIWLSDREKTILAERKSSIVHCPSTNLKMASGVADAYGLHQAGVTIALGSDGAPCNNRLDIWQEMRLAALLASWKHRPGAIEPGVFFQWATMGGAVAMRMQDRTGSLEQGKDADFIAIHPRGFLGSSDSAEDLYTYLVFQGAAELVSDVWVRGKQLLADRILTMASADEIDSAVQDERMKLLQRVSIEPGR